MNTCENCIHADVCKMWWSDAEGGCPQKKTESDFRHILRLIYADINGNANRCKAKSQEYYVRNKPESAFALQREGEIKSSCASRVKHYCRMIGFDPSAEEGEKNK